LLALLGAGFIGYLVGDMHAVTSRSGELNAAQNVALRFPESQTLAPRSDTAAVEAAADVTTGSTNTMVMGETQVSLLSPERMVPPPAPVQAAPVQAAPVQAAPLQAAPLQVASAEQAAPLPAAAAAPTHRVAAAVAAAKAEVKTLAVQAKSELKTVADAAARRANRAGFVLNDAQIASIKARLHLTADQERMWPGVEAALRNIAYVKTREAQHHGGATAADVAALNPDSAEVQGLKSAAVPLIMSFNDEQRSEVRNLAHVMGLDQLAAQF
jgi:hypothetical protein